jgi:hypothetical protein
LIFGLQALSLPGSGLCYLSKRLFCLEVLDIGVNDIEQYVPGLNIHVNDFNGVSGRATDYDWNTGGSSLRNSLIRAERSRTGLNDSHGFRTYYYGKGVLNRSHTRHVPLSYPIGPKL